MVIVIRWLLLSGGYCYQVVIVIRWLLLSGGYCYQVVIVISQLLESVGYCNHNIGINKKIKKIGISLSLSQSNPPIM